MAKGTYDWLSMLPESESSMFWEYEPLKYYGPESRRLAAMMFVAAVGAGVPSVDALRFPECVFDLLRRDIINSVPGLAPGYDEDDAFEFYGVAAASWAAGVPLDDVFAGW